MKPTSRFADANFPCRETRYTPPPDRMVLLTTQRSQDRPREQHRARALPVIAALVALCFFLSPAACAAGEPAARAWFFARTNFTDFQSRTDAVEGTVIRLSPELVAPAPWREFVLSWNVELPGASSCMFEARALQSHGWTRFYHLGHWSEDPQRLPRESVNGQRDADGAVHTDTLVLERPARRVQIRITLRPNAEGASPRLKLLGFSFCDPRLPRVRRAPLRAAWGHVLDVPQRSQVPFGERRGWCSPTSLSMVLAYWAARDGHAEWDLPVPIVAAGVMDPRWPGTGNWSFNAAYAGKFSGLRAFVARLNDLSDVEAWIDAGVPPVLSVSYDLLKGLEPKGESGHLVVAIGFTDTGDVIVNDPWARTERGETVRKVFPRGHVVQAWAASQNTAYIVLPDRRGSLALAPAPGRVLMFPQSGVTVGPAR
jgi:hypothetical protein